MQIIVKITLFTAILSNFKTLHSCPSYLSLRNDLPKLVGPRDKTHLFAFQEKTQTWQNLSLQIDPLDAGGGLQFFKDEKWKKSKLRKDDRIVLSTSHFASKRNPKVEIPCKSMYAYRLNDALNPKKFAYLLNCENSESKDKKKYSPLSYYLSQSHILSPSYSYKFDSTNFMIFKEISFLSQRASKLAAFDSNLLIHANLKHFFPLSFDSKNIESKLEHKDQGPLGINAIVSFYLRILFLRLKMALNTNVSFYENSVHIPMVAYLPANAKKYLKSNSGIFYFWKLSNDFKNNPRWIHMPHFNQHNYLKINNSFGEYKNLATPYCEQSKFCEFTFKLGSKSSLKMHFSIPKKLVKKGFYPVYVDDLQKFDSELNWGLKESQIKSHIGIFFATSGLGKGNHHWDFWMTLGDNKGFDNSCPYPLKIKELKNI